MKKLLYLTGLLFLFLSFSLSASATSGACSDHGGVDCSAGAGIYGQVICNDGWDGSSVSYGSMEECNQPSVTAYCTQPVASGCTTQEDLGSLEEQMAQGNSIEYASTMDDSAVAQCQSPLRHFERGRENAWWLVWTACKTKLSCKSRREMRELRDKEGKRPVVIPLVVRLVPIRLEPMPIVVPVRIEEVRVAVGIARLSFKTTAP